MTPEAPKIEQPKPPVTAEKPAAPAQPGQFKPYPKYEFEMTNEGTERLIIRAEHIEELKAAVDKARTIVLFQAKPTAAVENKPATPEVNAPKEPGDGIPMCPFHHKPMNQRQGQYGTFWTCSTKMEDGSWCPYKPPKKKS